MFTDVTASSGINFTDQESAFVDFKINFPLLPFQLSKIGPCIAKADVNHDGLEDIFIGASSGEESVYTCRTTHGIFQLPPINPGITKKKSPIRMPYFLMRMVMAIPISTL